MSHALKTIASRELPHVESVAEKLVSKQPSGNISGPLYSHLSLARHDEGKMRRVPPIAKELRRFRQALCEDCKRRLKKEGLYYCLNRLFE